MSRALWLLFTIFIVYGTTIPFDFSGDRTAIGEKVAALSWSPFVQADGRRVSIPDSVQNVMLFVPFGVLGAMALRTRIASGAVRVAAVVAAAALVSAVVETLQLFTVGRVTSVSDLATNTGGGFAGAVVVALGSEWISARLRDRRVAAWLEVGGAYPALVGIAAVVVAALEPFDLTLDVGSVASKVRALLTDPWQAGPLTDEGSAFILYTLVALALARWLSAAQVKGASRGAAGAGAALALGLELSQICVSSRMPSMRDALVRLAGVAIGVALWPLVRGGRGRERWLGLLFAGTVVSAAIMMLSPFAVADDPQPFSWFPFLGYYNTAWFPAVSHVIEVVLLYAPFGFCAGMFRRDAKGVAAATLACLLAATGVEYLQSWVVGRYADVTDVLVAGVGGALGAWLSVRGSEIWDRARVA